MSVEDCSSTPCKSYECGRQLVGWLVSVRQGEGGSRRLLILTLMYSWSFADWAQRILKFLLETDKEGREGELGPKGDDTPTFKSNIGSF